MVQRTEKPHIVIDSFEGINDAIDNVKMPPNLVSWAQGGFFTDVRSFQRLRGKTLISSNTTTHGRILTIKQLEFEARTVVVFHHSSVWATETDFTVLTTSTTSTVPLLPFIQ